MEGEGGADRAQLVLDMFDAYWFQHLILLATAHPLTAPSRPASLETNPVESRPMAAEAQEKRRPRVLHVPSLRRSLSEEVAATSVSPTLAFFPKQQHYRPHRKLHTIRSGKERQEGEEEQGPHEENRRSLLRGKGRSLSELEFEELKGFIDLGFTFSEEEAADPKLVSIVPGLQRLGKKKEEENDEGAEEEESSVSRPYLSEAWAAEKTHREREMRRRRGEEHALRNWRIPAAGDGAELKNHIRFWAHTVASAVR